MAVVGFARPALAGAAVVGSACPVLAWLEVAVGLVWAAALSAGRVHRGKEFESYVVRFARFSGIGGVVPLRFAGVFVLKVSFPGVLAVGRRAGGVAWSAGRFFRSRQP